MVDVTCRQCGKVTRLPDRHGAVAVVCDVCRWREVYPARRHIGDKLAHEAAAAFKAHERHETLVSEAIERLRGFSSRAFGRFCARLFEQMGHVVAPVESLSLQSHSLELHDGNTVTYVACKRALGHEAVTVEELENLVGAMRRDGAGGIFVTTGTFAEGCSELAAEASVELIDGEGLRLRMDSIALRLGTGTTTGTEGYDFDPESLES